MPRSMLAAAVTAPAASPESGRLRLEAGIELLEESRPVRWDGEVAQPAAELLVAVAHRAAPL